MTRNDDNTDNILVQQEDTVKVYVPPYLAQGNNESPPHMHLTDCDDLPAVEDQVMEKEDSPEQPATLPVDSTAESLRRYSSSMRGIPLQRLL